MKIYCNKQEQDTLIAYISEYCNGYGTNPKACEQFKDCEDCLRSGGRPTCLDSGISWEIIDE